MFTAFTQSVVEIRWPEATLLKECSQLSHSLLLRSGGLRPRGINYISCPNPNPLAWGHQKSQLLQWYVKCNFLPLVLSCFAFKLSCLVLGLSVAWQCNCIIIK